MASFLPSKHSYCLVLCALSAALLVCGLFRPTEASGSDAPAPSRIDTEWLTVPVQAVVLADDDGSRVADISAHEISAWVGYANRSFAPARVRFQFDPDRDMARLSDSLLSHARPHAPGYDFAAMQRRGDAIAARYPGKMVAFFRHGPDRGPTGNGFSWTDYNFVMLPGFRHTGVCGRQNIDVFAHETGHFLGLPHTFGRQFRTTAEAEAFCRENGGKPDVFDGDGLPDTAPTPHIDDLQCTKEPTVRIAGTDLEIPRRNVMSYYHGLDPATHPRTLTPGQAKVVRAVLRLRLAGGMSLPVNRPANGGIEAETLTPTETKDASTSVQDMTPFATPERWSGKKHLFCAFGRPGSRVSLPVSAPKAGTYRLTLYGTRAPDFGIFRVTVSGQPVPAGSRIDAYAPIVVPTGAIDLGPVTLRAGEAVVTLECSGRNRDSTGYRFGIDAVSLTPAL